MFCIIVTKWRVDKISVTLTYFSRPPSFKDCKNQYFWSCILWTFGWTFIKLAVIICLVGKKSNKILMALTLFLWPHKYFVISNVEPNCFYCFNIASSWHKYELIEIWENILAASINVFFCFVGVVIVFRWKHCFNSWLLGHSYFSSLILLLYFPSIGCQ